MLSFLNPGILAIDLGTSSIKIAHMSQINQAIHLHHCDLIDIHPGLIDERGNIADINKLQIYLKQVMQKYKINAKKCVMAVPSRSMVRDIIEIEALDETSEYYEMEMEASRMIPPSVQPSFDYRVMEQNAGRQKCEIFVTIKSLIDQRMELIQEFKDKKKLSVVDFEDFSMFRAINHIWQADQMLDQIRVVLDLGHFHSKFFVFQGKELIYQQDLVINGLQLTQQIMRYYQMSYQDAMYKKQKNQLPEGYIDAVLRPYIENASMDITQAIQNFFASSQFSRIDGIYATGGHALTQDFLAYIGQKTQLPIQLLNPFFGLVKSKDVDESILRAHMPQFLTAIGMGMRGLVEV
jgi:type IV pilus assembly protein PilM